MLASKVRGVVTVVGVALTLVAQPLESQAFFHGCGGCGSRTTYRPYVAAYAPAPACNTCSPCAPACPTVCNYVPTTCYRPVCCNVPVTAYQPVTTSDPCTGCPRTVLRPVTTYVTQQRMVPYMSLRPVMASPCAGGCGVSTVNYAPAMSYAPPVSGCSSCSAGYAPAAPTYAPAPPAYAPAPAPSYAPPAAPYTPAPSAQDPSAYTPAPSLNPPLSGPTLAPSSPPSLTSPESATGPSGPPQTFRDDSAGTSTNSTLSPSLSPSPSPNLNLRPIPDPTLDNRRTNLQTAPRLLDPQDRSTSRPIQRAVTYKTISTDDSASSADDGGWRSASR